MDDNESMWELKKLSANAEERIDYWLMAVAAAAIAFAIQQTHDSKMHAAMIPLGLAVLAWAFSFFAGYRRQCLLGHSLTANYDFLQLHSLGKPFADAFKESQSFRKAANRWRAWQFPPLMIGAFLYVLWHVVEMALRR